MSDLFQVFIDNILPIFVIAAMGYGLRAGLHLDKKVLSRAAFFALSPSLIFSLLVNSTLPGSEFLLLALYALVVTILFGVLGFVVGKLFRLPRADTIALMLVLMFTNSGNFGLTLNEIRFGNEGLERAIVYFIMSGMLVSTLGVFLASMGRTSARESLKQMIRLPAFYSVLLAIIVRYFSLTIPSPVMRGIELAGSGAIPVMLLVLGMQIADLKNLERVSFAVPATLLRLLVGPVIAVLVAGLVGLQGLNRTVSVVEASMPTAVYTTILATEYEIRPGFVTSTVTLSTLLSAITLPIVITLLKM